MDTTPTATPIYHQKGDFTHLTGMVQNIWQLFIFYPKTYKRFVPYECIWYLLGPKLENEDVLDTLP